MINQPITANEKEEKMKEILQQLGELEVQRENIDRKRKELLTSFQELLTCEKITENKQKETPKKSSKFPARLKRREEEAAQLIDLFEAEYKVKLTRTTSTMMCWELRPIDEPNIRWGLYLQQSGWSMDKLDIDDSSSWEDYFPSDVYDFAISNSLELF